MAAGARHSDLFNGPVQTLFQPYQKMSTFPPALNKAVKTSVGDHHQSDKNKERIVVRNQDAGEDQHSDNSSKKKAFKVICRALKLSFNAEKAQ